MRDDHILTVDRITFIADERFHAFYAAENSATSGMQPGSSGSATVLSATESTTLNGNGGSGNGASSGGNGNGPWTLQIKYVQARDAGLYECQISTEPKVSARIFLHVVGELDRDLSRARLLSGWCF